MKFLSLMLLIGSACSNRLDVNSYSGGSVIDLIHAEEQRKQGIEEKSPFKGKDVYFSLLRETYVTSSLDFYRIFLEKELWLVMCNVSVVQETKYKIVSRDNKNFRVFVSAEIDKSRSTETIFKKVIDLVREMKKDGLVDFNQTNLKVSIFDKEEFADYKPTDPNRFKIWKNSYLAEYSKKDSSLVILPMIFEKKIVRKVSF